MDTFNNNIVERAQDMLDNFIKFSNRNWINKKILYKPTKKGGIGFFDLKSRQSKLPGCEDTYTDWMTTGL